MKVSFISRLFALCLLAILSTGCSSATSANKTRPIPKSASVRSLPETGAASWGDAKIYAIIATQWWLGNSVYVGSRIDKICTLRTRAGRETYSLYFFQRTFQAAALAHGRADLIVISGNGNLLGSYSSEMGPVPKCADKRFREFTAFTIPLAFVSEGYQPFSRMEKFAGRTTVDRINLPSETSVEDWYDGGK